MLRNKRILLLSYYLFSELSSILKIGDKQSKLIEFKRIGIGPRNEVNTAGWQLKTLGTIIRDEGLKDVRFFSFLRM